MAWVESIQKAINFIEENLLEEMTIEQISKQANASAFHFQRTFTLLTNISIGEYVRRRRLTLAAQELITTSCKVIDVAYKYGYDTPEAFTKAFRRQHGIVPSEARKFVGKLTFYERLVIQVTLKGAEPMKFNIVERDSIRVIGKKREFSLLNEENLKGIPKMWDEVNSDGTCRFLAKSNNGQIKGILGVCVDNRDANSNQAMDYWVATEHIGETPEGYECLEIPASKWVIFEVRGAMPDAMQSAWKQIFSEWFPTSGYQHAGTPEFEMYTDDDPTSPDCYSELWIPIK
ncbi:AraC family transcriptional regulator [Bacillus luteolus]|uniref:AraC family transcriptional regulator n=1 Tax=Litchfieldia luteola TaxID=682179 RepID=A0ABR9QGB3_9BACI|nr:AraC family transcriptional regulator [Cytobacillus luteolus]MBE4907540.1 AraC family transcriptional regulator [Cytobacillus luteolus]MBP1944309.1 AraC family transcriptional regulator [Cytobacillus luteolus]